MTIIIMIERTLCVPAACADLTEAPRLLLRCCQHTALLARRSAKSRRGDRGRDDRLAAAWCRLGVLPPAATNTNQRIIP